MQKNISRVTSELKEDHKEIMVEIDRLTSLLRRGAGEQSSSASTSRSLHQIARLLSRHFDREEEELYSVLNDAMLEGQVVEAMSEEHRELRHSLRVLVDKPLCELDVGLLEKIKRDLGVHISKEEKVLFWIAEVKSRTKQDLIS